MKYIVLLIGIISILSCGTSREVSPEKTARLETLVERRNFEIQPEWAMPLVTNSLTQIANTTLFQPGDTASQINIQGNSNFLRFEKDSVYADLPYFGERQMGGGYNRNTGIQFKGVPKDLEITKEQEKNYYAIRFNISEDTENFQISLRLYPNSNALIQVNSSHRNTISYRGKLKELDKSE